MAQRKITVVIFFLCIICEIRCAYVVQAQVPSASELGSAAGQTLNQAGNAVGNAANTVGNAAGQTVNAAGQVVGGAVNTVGNVAGQTVNAAGQLVDAAGNVIGNAAGYTVNAAGQLVDAAGNVIGNAANTVGNAAGQLVDAAGNVIGNVAGYTVNAAGQLVDAAGNVIGNAAGYTVNAAGQIVDAAGNVIGNAANTVGNAAGAAVNGVANAGTYVLSAGGQLVTAAGRAIGNAAMFPINGARDAYNALQVRATELHVQMTAYRQALSNVYNVSSAPYMYQSALLDTIAIVHLQPYVQTVNQQIQPYNQMIQISRSGVGGYIFPTIYTASGTAYSLPNGFSIQNQNIVNARGMNIGAAPMYQSTHGGQVLQDPAGNQYVLGNDIYIDGSGNLRYMKNNQPYAVAGDYVIDLGGNVFDSGGNIIGNLCRCIGITGTFGPNGNVVLS